MFARTARLLLRPGFAEDAPMLAKAIADEQIVRNLARAPWPYGVDDAKAFLAAPGDPALPTLLVTERTDGAPRLVGACALMRQASGAVELGYWIARPHWNRGLATEACTAVLDIARALRLPSLEASYFVDNPASGRVLEKLGFRHTGLRALRESCARGGKAEVLITRLALGSPARQAAPIAA